MVSWLYGVGLSPLFFGHFFEKWGWVTFGQKSLLFGGWVSTWWVVVWVMLVCGSLLVITWICSCWCGVPPSLLYFPSPRCITRCCVVVVCCCVGVWCPGGVVVGCGVFLVCVRLCYIGGDTILLKCVFFYIIHLGTYVMCRYGKC